MKKKEINLLLTGYFLDNGVKRDSIDVKNILPHQSSHITLSNLYEGTCEELSSWIQLNVSNIKITKKIILDKNHIEQFSEYLKTSPQCDSISKLKEACNDLLKDFCFERNILVFSLWTK